MTGLEAPLIVWLLSMIRRGGPAEPKLPDEPKPDEPKPDEPKPTPSTNRWPRTVLHGGQVPIVRTWRKEQGGADAWRVARFPIVLAWLRGPAKLNEDELANSKAIATSVLAHWDLESAAGLAEYNWNAGGIGARPGDRYFASRDAQSQPPKEMAFTAYDSFEQFVADYFGVLALSRYSEALQWLLNNPDNDGWIRRLRKGGYYGAPEETVAKAWQARKDLLATATATVQ